MRNLLFPIFIFTAVSLCGKNVLPDSLKKSQRTFKVADVVRAKEPLNDTDITVVTEHRLGKKTLVVNRPANAESVVPVFMNGFMQTVHTCYGQHRPLVLSPDEIWLLICQGFSIHINENFEKHKDQLFVNDKPKEVCVREDQLAAFDEKGKLEGWKILLGKFSDSIKFYCKDDMHKLVVNKFSTTGPTEKTVFEITVMEISKKSFFFLGGSGCGIPEITLKGTSADWKKIYKDVDQFKKYGMEEWVADIKPVLKEFVNASEGKINKDFWNLIYKDSENYGPNYINGWIIKFFPYVKDFYSVETDSVANEDEDMDSEGIPNMSFRYVKNEFLHGEDYRISNLSTDNFPRGWAMADVKWTNYFKKEPVTKMMEVYGGFIGMLQDKKTMALEPLINWAVCEKEAEGLFHDLWPVRREAIQHDAEFWSPMVRNKKTDSPAIYHLEKNNTAEEGITELLAYLKKKIKTKGTENLKLEFVVTWGGTVANVRILNEKESGVNALAVKKVMENLPFRWKPATIKDYPMMGNHKEKLDFKVNYKLSLEVK